MISKALLILLAIIAALAWSLGRDSLAFIPVIIMAYLGWEVAYVESLQGGVLLSLLTLIAGLAIVWIIFALGLISIFIIPVVILLYVILASQIPL